MIIIPGFENDFDGFGVVVIYLASANVIVDGVTELEVVVNWVVEAVPGFKFQIISILTNEWRNCEWVCWPKVFVIDAKIISYWKAFAFFNDLNRDFL